mmetsp:Transcript_26352/g.76914  ORF Transcript_26352/g.76914 Transcript_26352/m.76914 type:complete len:238 (+) Transcript_26352:534-1247(+)
MGQGRQGARLRGDGHFGLALADDRRPDGQVQAQGGDRVRRRPRLGGDGGGWGPDGRQGDRRPQAATDREAALLRPRRDPHPGQRDDGQRRDWLRRGVQVRGQGRPLRGHRDHAQRALCGQGGGGRGVRRRREGEGRVGSRVRRGGRFLCARHLATSHAHATQHVHAHCTCHRGQARQPERRGRATIPHADCLEAAESSRERHHRPQTRKVETCIRPMAGHCLCIFSFRIYSSSILGS